jgi:hypothetical protein
LCDCHRNRSLRSFMRHGHKQTSCIAQHNNHCSWAE